MSSKRLFEVAREHNLSSDALMALVSRLGFSVRSHMSVATDDVLEAIEAEFDKQKEALKVEIAAREKKTRERKIKAKEVADAEAQRQAEIAAIAAEKARQEEEARKEKEAAAAALREAAEAQLRAAAEERAKVAAARARLLNPVPPPPPPQPAAPPPSRSATASPTDRPPLTRPRMAPTTITGRPAGAPPRHVPIIPGRTAAPALAAAPPSTAAPARPPSSQSPPARRKKRKDRRRGARVDQEEVAASFRKTIAQLGTRAKPKRRYRHDEEGGEVEAPSRTIEINEFMSVAELAHKMGVSPTEVVAKCLELGMLATVNQRLDLDTIETIALEFDYSIKLVEEIGEEILAEQPVDESKLQHRYPVVTVMGHVDHGKTSLLDYIRSAHVVAGEKGGITQHIGAYSVLTARGRVTFLDTPGHEAFTAMRARGAQATDIVILVVAVNDSVMPQTIEAIDHAKAANVPIIVAINKMDLPGADAERVRSQLSEHGLIPEEWGGKSIMVPVSAKTGEGVDHLLEMVLLQAELLELKADPDRRARGVVIEAQLDKGRGPVATILIESGTLKVGDYFVTGAYHGRVRTMVDERGRAIIEVGPSTPVQVTGSSGVPQAGDSFVVSEDDQQARNVAQVRERLKREQQHHRLAKASLTNLYERIKEGEAQELKIVIKGDVDGSVEVLADTLGKIKSEEIVVSVIHRGVGAITESDVLLAAASDAVIIGFHVRPDARARELAHREGVDLRMYDIIYEVESDIRKAIEGMLAPIETEERTGEAKIKEIFKVSKVGTVAGCEVADGTIHSRDQVRVVRDGVTIYSGMIQTLRRFQDDVKEVSSGQECGIKVENDVKVGDVLEFFRITKHERHLA